MTEEEFWGRKDYPDSEEAKKQARKKQEEADQELLDAANSTMISVLTIVGM